MPRAAALQMTIAPTTSTSYTWERLLGLRRVRLLVKNQGYSAHTGIILLAVRCGGVSGYPRFATWRLRDQSTASS